MISKIIKTIENNVYENKLEFMFSKLPLNKREELLNVKKEDVDTTNMTLGLICFYLIMLLLVLVAVMPSGHSFTTEETIAYNKLFTSANLSESQQITIFENLESLDDSDKIQELEEIIEDNLTIFENRLNSQDKILDSFNETLIEFLENQEEIEEEQDSSEERKKRAQEQRELLQEYYECQSTEAFSLIKLCDSIYPEFAGSIQQNTNNQQTIKQNLSQDEFNEMLFNVFDEDSFSESEDVYSVPSQKSYGSDIDEINEKLELQFWWNVVLSLIVAFLLFRSFSQQQLPSTQDTYDVEQLDSVKKNSKPEEEKPQQPRSGL